MSEQDVRLHVLQMVWERSSTADGQRPTIEEAMKIAKSVSEFIFTGHLPAAEAKKP